MNFKRNEIEADARKMTSNIATNFIFKYNF